MSRDLAGRSANPLLGALRDPAIISGWGAEDWNRFMPLARTARLLGCSLHRFEQAGLLDQVPGRLQDQLRGALAQTRYVQGQALRELRQVARVLHRAEVPLLALKGVAYLVAALPPSAWRNLSDVDLLVPEADIDLAEKALRDEGWATHGDYDAYDQRYYRDWMHEVPPLAHARRKIEVDLHHNLAPPVSRVRVDARRLWDDAVTVNGPYGLSVKVLAPVDMLLHNAVHLFMNDELRGGLRDVVDFQVLYEHFRDHDAALEPRLLSRAAQLHCQRPLYYALTTAQRLLGLTPAAEVQRAVARHAPPWPTAHLMHWMIGQVLAPRRLGLPSSRLAQQVLFMRSHWVRMPPGMLLRHLWHKATKTGRPVTHDAEMPG